MKRSNRIGRRWLLVSVVVALGFAAGPAWSDPTAGLCNAVVAQALGVGLQVANKGATFEKCTEIGVALEGFLTPTCLEKFLAGEIGLANVAANAPVGEGGPSPLGIKICTGLESCGFLPIPGLEDDLCPGFGES